MCSFPSSYISASRTITLEYWLRLERAMGDYEQRRRWLAENGASYLTL